MRESCPQRGSQNLRRYAVGLRDPGAQEYAANQTREEARHVTGFSQYVGRRWGTPLQCGPTLANLLDEAVQAPMVYKKLVGMQMLVEGLAMGAFAFIHAHTEDPTLKRLVQLVMADEAFHHRFGKIWADKTVPELSPEEHEKVEDWAAQCFQTLLFNLVNAEQKQEIYSEFGLEWQWVRSAVMEAFGEEDRRDAMRESTNIFRVLIKTLNVEVADDGDENSQTVRVLLACLGSSNDKVQVAAIIALVDFTADIGATVVVPASMARPYILPR